MATRSEDPIGLTEDALVGLDDFERLYDTTAELVLRFFFRRTACPETAADLTAETFAVALGSMESYRASRGSPRQWLFGIARNQLSRYLRWRRVETRARERLGMRPHVDLDSESRERIEDLMDLRERIGRLDAALDGLTRNLALAVNLRVGQELGYDQIAAELGISEAAARARVSRGLNQLARAFEEEM